MIKFVLLKTVIQRLNKIINWQFSEFWTMKIGLPVEWKYKELFLLGSLRKQSSIECLLLEYHLLKGLKSIFTLGGSSDPSHCMFKINFRERRIRHRRSMIDWLWNLMMNFFDSKSTEDYVIQSRSISDPLLSEIDFKHKMAWVWTTLNLKIDFRPFKRLYSRSRPLSKSDEYKNKK